MKSAKLDPKEQIKKLARRIRVARGQEPGDLLLRGAEVVNVFTERVEMADVVIADGWIAGVGPYEWQAHHVLDLAGKVIVPGLIDAHMHLESTLLLPEELARQVVPHGTTVIIADPHEIGNVLGLDGIKMLIEASEGLPLQIFFMASSCVPATSWEDSGAVLDSQAVAQLLDEPRILGLAEMMNFPGVFGCEAEVMEKIVTATSKSAVLDGHAPGIVGQDLVAYAAAGIRSDHESASIEEGLQKAALGMLVQVREGSSAHNLDTLLPLMADGRLGEWCLATDDLGADDLRRDGHIDGLLRRVVAGGVPSARAVRHATLIPARHYGLAHHGGIAPGYRADLVVVDDLEGFCPRTTIVNGLIVASDGKYLASSLQPSVSSLSAENTVHLAAISEATFELAIRSQECPVLGIVPDQIVTTSSLQSPASSLGCWTFDPKRDIVLVASLERHHQTGRVGLGLAEGFGLRDGALGSSVAHDSHNLIIAGTNPSDMLACARSLEETGGGFVTACNGQVKACLPLPVAGLISTDRAEVVCDRLCELNAAAKQIGCRLHSPFGTLSFLSLPVIPTLKITTHGMFDVESQQFVRY